jgi:hypothetical protein
MISGEPTFEELLSEPIVLLAARSAGLSPSDLQALCEQARERLMSDPPSGQVARQRRLV